MAADRRSTNAEQRQCASDVSPPSSAICPLKMAERGRIRTPDALCSTYQPLRAGALNHSATSPFRQLDLSNAATGVVPETFRKIGCVFGL